MRTASFARARRHNHRHTGLCAKAETRHRSLSDVTRFSVLRKLSCGYDASINVYVYTHHVCAERPKITEIMSSRPQTGGRAKKNDCRFNRVKDAAKLFNVNKKWDMINRYIALDYVNIKKKTIALFSS